MKVLTAQQMNLVDRLTTEKAGLPSLTLMENAGFNLYLCLTESYEHLDEASILIICGKGNNGGDGFVLARQLIQRGLDPKVVLLGSAPDVQGDAATNLSVLLRMDYEVVEVTTESDWDGLAGKLSSFDVIVDAILGTGLAKPLAGLYRKVVADINGSGSYVLAVDMPTGIASDAMEPSPLSVAADLTVTFTAPKIAHVLNPLLEDFGEIRIVPIGTPASLIEVPEHYVNLLTVEEVANSLPARPASSHKGTFGTVALVSGSRGKAGAAGLCSYASLRTGSGLVTVLCPESVQGVIASFHAEVMTEGLEETETGSFSAGAAEPVLAFLNSMDAAGVGPGLTTAQATVEFARTIVRDSPVPLVVDADALNAFAGCPELLKNRAGIPLVLTPHPGEFSRLCGRGIPEILADQIELTRSFAGRYGVWVLLKTFRPLLASPNGEVFISPLGNPGMATAGMGDVLTGILTSVIGRSMALRGGSSAASITEAVCLGLFLHGLAGDAAAEELGEEPLTAGDVIDALPEAFNTLLGGTE